MSPFNRKITEFKILSPQLKRKGKKDLNLDSPSKLIKQEIDFEKQLHHELQQLFKTKKHKEKMPLLIEKTFNYRRGLIENNSATYLDLMEDYSYLIDPKSVSL